MGLEWGWKIICGEPGCSQELHQFRKEGCPPLPHKREVTAKDWFWRAAAKKGEEGYNYHAYCPEHKAAAEDWLAAKKAWNRSRWKVGKDSSKGMVRSLKEWGAKLFHKRVGNEVEDWKTDNPAPVPPWEMGQ